jgi:hypothetical protein
MVLHEQPALAKIREVKWDNVRDKVVECNPELATLIDDLDANLKDEPLFLVTYDYGSIIVNAGHFQLPKTDDPAIKDKCAASIDQPIPLALVLSKSVEVYFDPDPVRSHVVPLRVFSPGELFGVFEAADRLCTLQTPNWTWMVSAGARSVHVLMSWKEAPLQRALTDQLRTPGERPDVFANVLERADEDSWPILKRIANRQEPGWSVMLLLLPKRWTSNFGSTTPSLLTLHNRLLKISWQQSAYLRGFSALDARLDFMRHEVPNYVEWDLMLSHIKQMIAISQGEAPAFAACTSSGNSQGPFQACQSWLMDRDQIPCKLRHYPVILQPVHLDANHCSSAYYSLSAPSMLAPTEATKPRRSWAAFRDSLRDLSQTTAWERLNLRFEIQPSDIFPPDIGQARLSRKHPFLLAYVKLSHRDHRCAR